MLGLFSLLYIIPISSITIMSKYNIDSDHHLCIHQYKYPFHPSIYSSICPSFDPFVHLFIHKSIRLSIHSFINPLILALINKFNVGIRLIYGSSFSQVPIGEMTSVLTTTVQKKPLIVGQWVRLKRGPLKGCCHEDVVV